jgi:hypothetical protein
MTGAATDFGAALGHEAYRSPGNLLVGQQRITATECKMMNIGQSSAINSDFN